MSTRNIVAIIILLLAGIVYYVTPTAITSPAPSGEIPVLLTPSGMKISLHIADTDSEREKGLGERTLLPHNQGMLFVFPQDGLYQFWMKGMEFPLDIVWLDDRMKVVYLKTQVATSTYPKFFGPSVPARYVLELNAGTAEKGGITERSTLLLE